MMSKKVFLISLGCPKNRVDSERTLWALKEAGAELTSDQNEADILLVNTCGFTADAKEESVDTILDLVKAKEANPGAILAVMGCLTERYREELGESVPEIDHIFGVAQLKEVVARLAPEAPASHPDPDAGPRLLTTAPHWAYLKIAEGCSNKCSFCVIPSIRGPFKSLTPDVVMAEADLLVSQGVKELIIVAQDTTLYGADIKMKEGLACLLRRLVGLKGIEWIRVMYMYPGLINGRLLDIFANEEKVMPYFDLPLQHISDNVLKLMRRPDTSGSIRKLLHEIRRKIPDAAIRSSFIAGFPGETESDFEELLNFVKESRIDHLGAFVYSPEEGTEAFDMSNAVEKDVAQERYGRIMEAQKIIAGEQGEGKIGSIQEVMVDMHNEEENLLTGRMKTQAPEIDGVVILDEVEANPGDIIPVKITGALEYDLVGRKV